MTCSYFVYKFLRKHFKMDKWKVYFNTLWHFVTKLSTLFLYQFKIHYKISSHSFLLHLGIVQFSAKAPPLSHQTAAHPWSSTFHTDQWLQLYSTWAGSRNSCYTKDPHLCFEFLPQDVKQVGVARQATPLDHEWDHRQHVAKRLLLVSVDGLNPLIYIYPPWDTSLWEKGSIYIFILYLILFIFCLIL